MFVCMCVISYSQLWLNGIYFIGCVYVFCDAIA